MLDSGFYHATGHGVGLEVHEKPNIGRSGEPFVAGDVLAIEPGLYRAGYGGVRLEDLVLVTDDGAEVLTDFPYDLRYERPGRRAAHRRYVSLAGAAPRGAARRPRSVRLSRARRREARLRQLDGGEADRRPRPRHPCAHERGVRERRAAARGVHWFEARPAGGAGLASVGLQRAVVPPVSVGLLEHIRSSGVELWSTSGISTAAPLEGGHELDGIRLRSVPPRPGCAPAPACSVTARARENLTVEEVKAAVGAAFEAHGCSTEDFIVPPGRREPSGTRWATDRSRAGEPVIFDLWPRDRESSCFADMTRTFVAGGEPDGELASGTRCTREAVDSCDELVRPGVPCKEIFDVVCDIYEEAGQPTLRTKQEGEVLRDGFFHGLGHGVGLEVHERPVHDDRRRR